MNTSAATTLLLEKPSNILTGPADKRSRRCGGVELAKKEAVGVGRADIFWVDQIIHKSIF